MSRFFDLVTRPAREMEEYRPPSSQLEPEPQPRQIRLDSNENPYGPSPQAMEAMRSVLTGAHSYPDDDCSELRQKLAEFHNLPLEQVLITAGSTALLGLLCQTMLAPGLNAVTSERSFVVYAMAVHASGARLIETPMRDDSLDLAAILNAINEDTRIVFIANPNNPTGTVLPPPALDRFMAEVPGHVVVVIDEAYYEYTRYFALHRQVELPDSIRYLQQGASVVILRTFSKVHGLAGLRVGYGIGPGELLAYCARMRNTFSVSSVAQAAALAAMDDAAHIESTVASNAAQSQAVGVGLSELGYRVVPTWANFLYVDVEGNAADFAGRLHHKGVSVRPLGVWGAPNSIRVSIGTLEQNQFLLDAMRKIKDPHG
ncbi:MAG TPA: histidinol-phosphate transaminase [Verrucomicrobiae bacterium]|nr:histidinol-phosphate transaminase [Verrucomicrobiae bacterium]